MTRLSRLVLGAALVSATACGGTPTAPAPAPNTMAPDAGALFDGSPPSDDCRGGYSVQDGKAC
jgi:hypothetical protein